MSDLLAARSQMAVSLAFHIIFAVIGIAMPVLMVLAERCWQRTRDPVYLDLAKRWARHGHSVRRRCGVRDGPLFRARTALAALHGARGFGHRYAVLPRGLCLLHGGDLPRHLPLWLGEGVSPRPPARGRPGRAERRGVRHLRRHRERLDEYADRLHARERLF